MIAGRFGRCFLLFGDSGQKCFAQKKYKRSYGVRPHTQPQCTLLYTDKQPQKMLITFAGRGREYVETLRVKANFVFLITIPKKLGDFEHDWETTERVKIF